jgi:hypothetical protein
VAPTPTVRRDATNAPRIETIEVAAMLLDVMGRVGAATRRAREVVDRVWRLVTNDPDLERDPLRRDDLLERSVLKNASANK